MRFPSHPDLLTGLSPDAAAPEIDILAALPDDPAFDGIATSATPAQEAEQKIHEAEQKIDALWDTYDRHQCPAVMETKSQYELGSMIAGALGLLPVGEAGAVVGFLWKAAMGGAGIAARHFGNEAGLRHAVTDCERIVEQVKAEGANLARARQHYKDVLKNVYGIYSVRRQIKLDAETTIRDWRNYKYKLEVWRQSLDPSAPKPVVPVYAFKATPVPSERDVALGAQIVADYIRQN